MEFVRQVAHASRKLIQLIANTLQLPCRPLLSILALDGAQFKRDSRDLLVKIIVQLARYSRSLLLLCID
jgi:hypothetical protein